MFNYFMSSVFGLEFESTAFPFFSPILTSCSPRTREAKGSQQKQIRSGNRLFLSYNFPYSYSFGQKFVVRTENYPEL